MSENQQKNKRRTIRLKNYDYSQNGFYFITICTWEHKCIFGQIENGQMFMSKFGKIADKEWHKTEKLRRNVRLKEFIIMPNHMHGIIELTSIHNTTCRGTAGCARLIHDTEKNDPFRFQYQI